MLTITPPVFCCIICLPAHLQPRNTPLRLIPITVFQPLIEMSSGLARNEAPALLTITSSRPHSDTARSITPLTWSSCRTSMATANVRRPRLVISLATGSRCSSLRLHRATSAPARANSIAIDLPMPVPPPVTMAVLPSSEKGDLAMAGTILQPRGLVYCRGAAAASGWGSAIWAWRLGTSRSIFRHTVPCDDERARGHRDQYKGRRKHSYLSAAAAAGLTCQSTMVTSASGWPLLAATG